MKDTACVAAPMIPPPELDESAVAEAASSELTQVHSAEIASVISVQENEPKL